MRVTLTIDGKLTRAEKGAPLIQAARNLGITIPALCYHRALKPYGACRLCVVEVIRGGRKGLVTSCNYPSEEGIEVFTDTPDVRSSRRLTMELLLARCPDVPKLREMARRLGVFKSRFGFSRGDNCILCGLCVRACEEIVGANAISLADRGTAREVAAPFGEPSETCIGCGSCTYICPTGCIEMDMNGDCGILQMNGHNLMACPARGECAECEMDRSFLRDLRSAIAAFRAASHSDSQDSS